MVHHLVGQFLTAARASSATGRVSPPEPCAGFIAETRPSWWLRPVTRNAVEVLGLRVLYVCGPAHVRDIVADVVVDLIRIEHIDVPTHGGGGGGDPIGAYSALMMSEALWARIAEPWVLVFQIDCALLRPLRAEHFAFDYIGAVCGDASSDETFVINGGLSLRRTEAMRAATQLMTAEDRGLPEDVAFTRVMRRHPDTFSLPSMRACHAFSMESIGDPRRVVGMHGTDKYYAPDDLVAAAFFFLDRPQ
jgi:hypothetical protein